MKIRTFGSFCSGIGAPEVAWSSLGWKPRFFSEIEPFPCAVLAHHFPGVQNFGDMTAINTTDLPEVDLWVAGTPCQAFSVAGLRRSLADDRGNLTLQFCRMIHERKPACVVWENVPGVLSTKDNAFGCFLAGLVGELQPLTPGRDGWADAGMVIGPERSAAWRILDAQFFRLAQRRRRVFVVSFRTGDGINPGAVLFEPESLPRDSAPSREEGQRIAASFTRGADSGGTGGYAGRRREDDTNIVAGCLNSGGGNGGFRTEPGEHLVATVGTLTPGAHPGSYNGQDAYTGHLVAAYGGDSRGERSGDTALTTRKRDDFDTETFIVGPTHSLRADGFDASEDGTGRGTPLVPVVSDTTQITSAGNYSNPRPGEPCHPLASGAHAPAVAFTIHGTDKTATVASETDIAGSLRTKPPGSVENSSTTVALAFAQNQRDEIREMSVVGALAAEPGMKQQTYVAAPAMAVRRLMPVECEKLQGFPPGYTEITFKKKPAADGPRYRALGNSMAVPVVRWIGERIEKVLAAFESRAKEAA